MSEVMTSEEKAIAALREEMERKSGCKMQTPKDFEDSTPKCNYVCKGKKKV